MLMGSRGMVAWVKTAQGIAAIVVATFATMVARWNLGLPRLVSSLELAPIHARIEALEQWNRNTRLLVLDQAWWRANPLRMVWPEGDGVAEWPPVMAAGRPPCRRAVVGTMQSQTEASRLDLARKARLSPARSSYAGAKLAIVKSREVGLTATWQTYSS